MKSKQLFGKNLVFTGASSIKRDYLFALTWALDAVPQKGINKQTNLLVIGEKPGNSKLRKAEKYGVSSITDKEFVDAIVEKFPGKTPEEIIEVEAYQNIWLGIYN